MSIVSNSSIKFLACHIFCYTAFNLLIFSGSCLWNVYKIVVLCLCMPVCVKDFFFVHSRFIWINWVAHLWWLHCVFLFLKHHNWMDYIRICWFYTVGRLTVSVTRIIRFSVSIWILYSFYQMVLNFVIDGSCTLLLYLGRTLHM